MIDIYKDYTTNNVLMNEPYKDDNLILYPIKVKDYNKFLRYSNYLLYSKKHYGVKDRKIKLLDIVLGNFIAIYMQQDNIEENIALQKVVKELEELFTMVCMEKISLDMENGKDIVFINESKTIYITPKNFDKLRIIVLKQNLLQEPKLFEDEMEKKLAEKWLKAKQSKNKNKINGIGEMANLVSCATGKSYNELYNQNILQFYVDYDRCVNNENYKVTSMFRTVSDKIDIVDYTKEVISSLYADPYEGMWKDFDAFMSGLS